MDCNQITLLARIYAARSNYRLSTVARYMGGSGDTISRLEAGHDLTMRRYNRFMQWFSDHWPDDLEWPSDIPRPDPARDGDRDAA